MFRQHRHIVHPLAQGRHHDREHENAVIQVLAKRSFPDERLEIAVCRSEHACIHHDRALAANPFELAFLQQPQQLRLHGRRHVADFVEEQRTAVRLLELAQMAGRRAGERPLFVSEQLRLDQLRRHGRTVHGDERPFPARAAIVNGARHELFAGAGLAEDADAGLGGGDAIHLRHHPAERIALPDDLVPADAAAKRPVLVFQAHELQRVFNRQQQLVGRDGLLEEIDGAKAGRPHRHIDGGLTRNHDHWSRDTDFAQLGEHRKAVLSGHHDVGEDDVEAVGADQGNSTRGIVTHDRLVTGQPERPRNRRERRWVIVHDQHTRHTRVSRGISTWNVVPRPCSLSTQMRPRWSATTD